MLPTSMKATNAVISACTTVIHCETTAALFHCTCGTSSSFAGNDELVAVDDFINVGNVLLVETPDLKSKN